MSWEPLVSRQRILVRRTYPMFFYKNWCQGIMFEATQEIVKRAFGQYGFKRLQAWCIKENLASSSLMKILGMRNPRNPRYVSVR